MNRPVFPDRFGLPPHPAAFDAGVPSAAMTAIGSGEAVPSSGPIPPPAGMVGPSGGAGSLATRKRPDRTIRSGQQLESVLEGATVVELPSLRDAQGSEPGGARLFTSVMKEPRSVFAQALQRLRQHVLPAVPSARPLTIGIVSWAGGEGRSAVASGLALLIGAARDGVTLIDADLRNPALSRVLTPQAVIGLDQALLDSAARVLPLAIVLGPTIDFVPAVARGGACNPHAFIGSEEMQHLLAALRKEEQHVIIDLPPMSRSSDVQALAPFLDGVILVAEADRTTIDDMENASRALRDSGTTLLGAVLNKRSASGAGAESALPPPLA